MVILLIIVAIVVIAISWFRSELKPKGPTIGDMCNYSDRKNGNYMNIYKSKVIGNYYPAKEPNLVGDKLVFSGTEYECGVWLLKNGDNW